MLKRNNLNNYVSPKSVWSGGAANYGTPPEPQYRARINFEGHDSGDTINISSECGNTKTGKIVLVGIDKIQFRIQRQLKLAAFQVAHSTKALGANESQFHRALAWRLNQWYLNQHEEWERNMAEAWRQFGLRDPAWVKARDEFLIKRDSYPSTNASKEKGIRLKVPTFTPVPPSLKRKPN